MDEFKKTNGMWNVGEYFMLSHPVTMLKSMEQKNHDIFVAFVTSDIKNMSMDEIVRSGRYEILLPLHYLQDYITEVKKANK